MDHEQYDQLISAYLDGELNAEEHARVEQLLVGSAEARQLVEELKAIRAGLQSLPRHQLEPDFAQQVLHRAEQAAKSPAAQSESKAAILAGHDYWDTKPSVFRSKRGIAWSLVAIAAAVIIMVATRNDDQAGRQIAQQPAKEERQATRVQSAEGKVGQQLDVDRQEPQIQPSMAASPNVARDENRAGGLAQSRNAVGGAARTLDSAAPVPAAPQPSAATAQSNLAESASLADEPAQAVLVVQVGLKHTPDAGKEFEKVLSDNRIVLENDRAQNGDQKFGAERRGRKDVQSLDDVERELTAALQQDANLRLQSKAPGMKATSRALVKRAKTANGLDVVYVEASPEQVRGVLDDLGRSQSVVTLGVTAMSQHSGVKVESSTSMKVDALKSAVGRAQRVPAVREWFSENVDNLPETILRGEQEGSVGNEAVKMQPDFGLPYSHDNSSSSLAVDKSQLRSRSAPAAGAMDAARGTFRPAEPEPGFQRALFVLQSVDVTDTAKPADAASAGQPGPVESGAAAEKQ